MGSADHRTIVEGSRRRCPFARYGTSQTFDGSRLLLCGSVNVRSAQDVTALMNRLNAEGVTVYRRLSPPILIDMMKAACQQSARFHESLDPFAPARFAVSWAGEETSLNWFDTARELTERWHHQQQIRIAASRPDIMSPGP